VEILLLLIFISFVLFAGALLCFAHTVHTREYDAIDHSSLLPLQSDIKPEDRS